MSGKMTYPVPSWGVRRGGGAMLTKWLFTSVSLCLFSALLVAGRVASQSAQPAPAAQQAGAQQQASGQSGYVLKVTTRLVTLDLIATDAHGNPVRDLKPEDLQIFEEHKAQQKIEHFEYFEKVKFASAADNSPSTIRKRANVISNQLPLDQLKIPPTV